MIERSEISGPTERAPASRAATGSGGAGTEETR
jgi:hypothetical protein